LDRAVTILAVTAALTAPFVLDGFATYQLTLAACSAIAILGLNLLIGFNGQFSLGHGAFYGLGGYVAAVATSRWGVSAYASIPAAGLVCFAVGFLVGLPTRNLPFLSLALATYAVAMAMPQLLKSSLLARWTGGVQGLYLDRPAPPFGLPVTDDQWWYFVTLFALLPLFWLARNLVRSRTGRALRAIRDNPIAAGCSGVNLTLYKSFAFGTSACCAGVAGALAAFRMDFVAPDSFTWALSLRLLIGAVAGGIDSLWGAIAGGLFIQYLPDLAGAVSKNLAYPVYGAVLLLTIWVMPGGAAGLVRAAAARAER